MGCPNATKNSVARRVSGLAVILILASASVHGSINHTADVDYVEGGSRPSHIDENGNDKQQRVIVLKKTLVLGIHKDSTQSKTYNADYLNSVVTPPAAKSMNQDFFDKKITTEASQKYNAYNNTYEFKKSYGIATYQDEVNYQNSSHDLADWLVKQVMQSQVDKTVKDAKESPNSTVTTQAATSAASTMQAIRNTTVNMGDKAKFNFKYDYPTESVKMGMTSMIVDTTMDYSVRPVNPNGPPPVGQPLASEKFKLQMSRKIALLDASTGVGYGITSQSLDYSINKHLVGPLSAQVERIEFMNYATGGQNQLIGRLNFGFSF